MPDGFPAHEYDVEFTHHLGPNPEWKRDLDMVLRKGPFTIIIHGVMGAGKSRLIEFLTGITPDTISGINESGAGGHSTESELYKFVGGRGRFISIIDTPGFGERERKRQEMVLEGVDQAIGLARDSRAPLKRLYFMLDWAKDSEIIPDALINNLSVLKLAYGSENISRLRFIVSKFDRIDCKFSQAQISCHRREIYEKLKEHLGIDLEPNSILFVSAGGMNIPGCIAQLTEDLISASHEPDMDISPRPLPIESEYVKPLFDLHRVVKSHAKDCNHKFGDWPEITSIRQFRSAQKSILVEVNALYQFLKSRSGILDEKIDKDIMKGIGSVAVGVAVPPLGLALAAWSTYKGVKHNSHMKDSKKALAEIETMISNVLDELPHMCQ